MAQLDTGLTTRRREALSSSLERFVGADEGRSIAVVVVVDDGDEVRTGRGADTPRPAASLMKLPVVMAVLRAGSGGLLDLDEPVSFGDLPVSALPAITDVLDRSHVASLRELCGLALVTSDNPLAEYLLDRVGRERVEDLLLEIGCHATSLVTGFSDEDLRIRPRHNRTNAADMLRVLDRLLTDDEMQAARYAIERTPKASRIPLHVRSVARRTGHKTGSLAAVCNDIGFVADDRFVLRVAVLCDDQQDEAQCGLDIGACVASIWRALATGDA